MKAVYIESPYASDDPEIFVVYSEYLRDIIVDCLARNESPFAPHGFYTHFLDDKDLSQRQLGMDCSQAWQAKADCVVVYEDHGISTGMHWGITNAKRNNIEIEFRTLY